MIRPMLPLLRHHLRRPALGALVAALALSSACRTAAPPPPSPATLGASAVAASLYDPSRVPGPLFFDVQMSGIFPDSKTFVDARPLLAPAEVAARYAAAKGAPGFNLRRFIDQNFELPRAA